MQNLHKKIKGILFAPDLKNSKHAQNYEYNHNDLNNNSDNHSLNKKTNPQISQVTNRKLIILKKLSIDTNETTL